MAIVVTEEEFLHWRDSRVTRAFMYALKQDREWLKEMLLAGTEDDAGLRVVVQQQLLRSLISPMRS